MKKHEVPQDDKGMLDGKFREPCYSVDENGKYVTVRSTGWEPKNIIMQQVWDQINKETEKSKKSVLMGKQSPIVYYLKKTQMDIKLLSGYTGFSKRKIRKHFNPGIFYLLPRETHEIYAEVFNISIDELLKIE